MAKKFDLKNMLNSQSKELIAPVEDNFVIKQIPLDKLKPSAKNNYGIRDIDELAANIEENGLMHNLVVREIDGGLFEIISGERRYHACKSLFDGGNERFETLPCNVKNPANDTIAELLLLYGNSTTRVLTDYEKTNEAVRIRELLNELKASGHEFSGRMRDIVAELLNVSPAQVGRMESIDKHLNDGLKQAFKDEKIGVTAAYELSKKPEPEQRRALDELEATGKTTIKKPKENINKPRKKDAECSAIISGLLEVAEVMENGLNVGELDIAGVCRKAADFLERI